MKKSRSVLILIFLCALVAMSYPAVALFQDPVALLAYLGLTWAFLIAALFIWGNTQNPKVK